MNSSVLLEPSDLAEKWILTSGILAVSFPMKSDDMVRFGP